MSSPRGKKPQVEPTRRALLRGLGLTLAVVPVLTACGEGSFSPMYGVTASGERLGDRLAQVDIAPIPSRVGQRIRNELIFHNTGGGEAPKPAYRLEIAIREGLNSTLVTASGEAFSQVYNVDAGYQLISLKDKAVVLKGCDEPGTDERDLCAQLRCQKSVLEQRRVPLRAQFQIERPSGRWIGGRALDARGQSVLGHFACEQQAGLMGPARWLTREQFEALDTATPH